MCVYIYICRGRDCFNAVNISLKLTPRVRQKPGARSLVLAGRGGYINPRRACVCLRVRLLYRTCPRRRHLCPRKFIRTRRGQRAENRPRDACTRLVAVESIERTGAVGLFDGRHRRRSMDRATSHYASAIISGFRYRCAIGAFRKIPSFVALGFWVFGFFFYSFRSN